MTFDTRPSGHEPPNDIFLRRIVWWLWGTILYLQLLSIFELLNNVVLTSVPIVAALIGFVVLWHRSRSLKYVRPISLELFAAILVMAVYLFLRATEPPRGYDVLAYHLPYTVEWTRAGWAEPFYTPFSGPVGYYPGNLELLALPFLSISHSAYLLNAINIISYLLIAGVVWPLAKRVNVRPSLAVCIVTLQMLTSRVTLTILGNAYNDLFLAATLLAAWYFAEEYFRTKSLNDVVLAGLLLGLALGTKYSGILYAIVVISYFAIRARQIRPVAILCVSALLPCIYWYARNFVITGNPVYPQIVSLFGWEILPGYFGARPDRLLFLYLGDRQFVMQLFRALVTYGHVLLVPLLIIFPWRKFFRPELKSYWIAGLAALGIYLFTPFSAEDYNHVYINYRYALPFQWFIVIAGALAVLSAFPLTRLIEWTDKYRVKVSYSLIGVIASVAVFGGYLLYQGNYVANLPRVNPKLGASWAFIESLRPSRIAFAGWDVSGALYGSHLQNAVQYVNLNAQNGRNYHEYHELDHRANQDYDVWLMNLDAARIDLLWIYKRLPTVEREWIAAHPKTFRTIYEDEGVKIVRLQGMGSDETYNTALYQ